MSTAATCDFLVIGGGVVGISIARELRRKNGRAKILLLEKETECGRHASGRNSGVIHAGFYYSADSLKARFTRAGNRALTAYCEDKNIPLNRCGKLVVAQNESELTQLNELLRRGDANGVPLESMSEADARKIEPRVETFQRAIFSPTTSSASPAQVLDAMQADAKREGIEILTNVCFLKKSRAEIITERSRFSASHVINAAGLYADKIARAFGFSENYRILPFKGLYLHSDQTPGVLRTNIYPVPDLRNPFLGVHFTVSANGHIKIGPTAIPALWREQYGARSITSSSASLPKFCSGKPA